ncbi:MAG: hypothetical protein HRT68_16700 [Flavobacteriaceae bacterium]|nr:hypothetical protein [Flavobacteriaceae bacterium]
MKNVFLALMAIVALSSFTNNKSIETQKDYEISIEFNEYISFYNITINWKREITEAQKEAVRADINNHITMSTINYVGYVANYSNIETWTFSVNGHPGSNQVE